MRYDDYIWKERILPRIILGAVIAVIAGIVYGGVALYHWLFG